VGLFKYIKTAFLNQWNLLGFAAAMGFAILSGHADVAIPLVLAGETAYLGFLGGNPRFQKAVDAQEHKRERQRAETEAVDRLLAALPPAQRHRFETLKDRCLALREIAAQIHEPGGGDSLSTLEEIQVSDLDRLLWIYLRTLYMQHMLGRFLENTSVQGIESEVRQFEERLRRLEQKPDSPNRSKIRQSLEASLETGRARLSNLQKARENQELLQAEIENLESKIQSITEMSINRGDAAAITGQVDEITRGLVRTEQTINDLGLAGDVPALELTAPKILFRPAVQPAQQLPEEPPARGRQRKDEIRYFDAG
jgi:hypothetical protein